MALRGVRMLVMATTLIAASATNAAGQRCPDAGADSSVDTMRRQAAMRFVAAVNAAQARRQRETGRYGSLHELGQPPAPLGYVPRLVVDQFGYVLRLADVLDPCGFALFSDERGIVYHGYPVSAGTAAHGDQRQNEDETGEGGLR